jgi:FkbM family methyltransferase
LKKITITHDTKKTTFVLNNPQDHIQKTIIESQAYYEQGMLEDIKDRLAEKSATKIVDVGAYIGNHSLFFATHCNAEVYSFEPFKDSFENFQKNIAANGLESTIHSYNIALGDVPAKARMSVPQKKNIGMNQVIQDSTGDVDVMTLDDVLYGSVKPIDLMKVDVEGMELSVLKGAKRILKRDHPYVYVEAFEPQRLTDISNYLERLGYQREAVFNSTPTYLFSHHKRPSRLSRAIRSIGRQTHRQAD